MDKDPNERDGARAKGRESVAGQRDDSSIPMNARDQMHVMWKVC